MAASISMSPVSGYPTKDTMVVTVNFTVQYPGDYYTRFDVYDYRSDELYNTYYGSTYTMPANGSKKNLRKTLSGLQPGTKYYVEVSMWNCTYSNPGNQLPGITDTVTFTTKSSVVLTVNFYDGSSYDVYRTEDYVDLYAGSRSGWTFVGWATSTRTTSIKYKAGDRIYVGTSSKSINLYAVYERRSVIWFYYRDSTGDFYSDSSSAVKIQSRVNTSDTSASENYYNTISLPGFDEYGTTIRTSTPARSWTAVGWSKTTSARYPDYVPSQNVKTNNITDDCLYAVYTNECSIDFNSNGGSGTMSELGPEYAYYNAHGNYTTPSFTIPSCAFTPPTGKKFSSWNQYADGSGQTYSGSVSTNYNLTLYAIWVKARPSNWSWPSNTADKPISKGFGMNFDQSGTTITPKPLTAAEWLAFMNRIKEFYAYDNGKTVNSTYWNNAVNGVKSGSPMTATQVNSARYLISQLSIQTALPSAVSSGTVITAAFVNGLKDSLNSIP